MTLGEDRASAPELAPAPDARDSDPDRFGARVRPEGGLGAWVHRWFGAPGPREFVIARWIVLRGLGLIFFSAFYSFARQAEGLMGPRGILPAADYLASVRQAIGTPLCYAYVPTLLWLGAGTSGLRLIVAAGLLASLLLAANVAPRIAVIACGVMFLSLVSGAQVFSSYQSDGMLLEAALLATFFAPGGLRPGLAADRPAPRAARALLLWEWFRIYFESGVVKLASGDPQWRSLTALDRYYENGPLPTWVAWYAQHLPHPFHAATALATLVIELSLVWLAFFPRRLRLACFAIVTPFQLGIIATANYAFLNYLVLLLGFLLVDDHSLRRLATRVLVRFPLLARALTGASRLVRRPPRAPRSGASALDPGEAAISSHTSAAGPLVRRLAGPLLRRLAARLRARRARLAAWSRAVVLATVFEATLVRFPLVPAHALPSFVTLPADLLEPFRVANRYGLFAVMTTGRIEIEFQGSVDGATFVPYPFRFKPQDPHDAPGIYAPYQPRFDWNLWFCSLEDFRRCRWILHAQARLLEAEPAVLSLFAADPFDGAKPRFVRTVAYRYWFSDWEAKRRKGVYWEREELGGYAPVLERMPDGTIRLAR